MAPSDEHRDRRVERHLLERVLRHPLRRRARSPARRRSSGPRGASFRIGPGYPSSPMSEVNYSSGEDFVVEFLGYRFGFNARRLRAADHGRRGAARADRGERPGRGGDRRSGRARRRRPHRRAAQRPRPLPRPPLGARRAVEGSRSSTGCASSSSAAPGSTTASRRGCSRSRGTRNSATSPTRSRAAAARCSSSRPCRAGTRCSSGARGSATSPATRDARCPSSICASSTMLNDSRTLSAPRPSGKNSEPGTIPTPCSTARRASSAASPPSGSVSHVKKPPRGRVQCALAGIERSSAASIRSHLRRRATRDCASCSSIQPRRTYSSKSRCPSAPAHWSVFCFAFDELRRRPPAARPPSRAARRGRTSSTSSRPARPRPARGSRGSAPRHPSNPSSR